MAPFQQTIGGEVTVAGVGLHTGQQSTVTIKPAPENSGLVFVRTDLDPNARIEAHARFVAETSRGTFLQKDGIKVCTTEHILAALTGQQIDNAIIELNCEEMPILDGSSRVYADLLKDVGIVIQKKERRYLVINEPIRFYDPDKDCEIIALPSEEFRVTVLIDFNSKVLGKQYASLDKITEFATQIAPSRTFVFFHELEYLLSKNLIKGGDLNNAIVFVENQIEQKDLDRMATVFEKPSVEVRKEGILNNLELNFDNEPARHKLLDLMGDLSLVGLPIIGHIIAKKPGHKSNVQFAKELIKIHNNMKEKEQIPTFDPNQPPLYDTNQVMAMLPHRPPFLLVDKIIEMGPDYVVGVKNVTMNEPFFVGHFPKEPIMPGVLLVEAMAQTGGILVLSQVEKPEEYSTYFLKIDSVKFKRKVVPGDTLVFKLRLVEPIRRGLCQMEGKAYVGSNLVVEAEMMAQVVKNQ